MQVQVQVLIIDTAAAPPALAEAVGGAHSEGTPRKWQYLEKEVHPLTTRKDAKETEFRNDSRSSAG